MRRDSVTLTLLVAVYELVACRTHGAMGGIRPQRVVGKAEQTDVQYQASVFSKIRPAVLTPHFHKICSSTRSFKKTRSETLVLTQVTHVSISGVELARNQCGCQSLGISVD